MATSRTRKVKEITPQELVDQGCVEFFEDNGDRWYEVTRPGSDEVYTVDRDEERRVRCTCPEYEHAGGAGVAFDCLDKKAVKLFMKVEENRKPMITKNTDDEMSFESAGSKKTSDVAHPRGARTDWLAALAVPIPEDLLSSRFGWRDKFGEEVWVEYVEWHTVVDRLNEVCGTNWSSDVQLLPNESMPVCKATITIKCGEAGEVTVFHSGIGTGKEFNDMGIKKAEHDALKRAAVKFGIAIELYKKEKEDDSEPAPRQSSQPSTPVSRAASSRQPSASRRNGGSSRQSQAGVGEVTPKQLGLIRALANEKGVDPVEECMDVTSKEPEDLSKREASDFIGHLQSLEDFG